MIQLNPFICG